MWSNSFPRWRGGSLFLPQGYSILDFVRQLTDWILDCRIPLYGLCPPLSDFGFSLFDPSTCSGDL
jgi:hypothetical protein